MKVVNYLGLTIFVVGIALFFIRILNPSLLSAINDKVIDILWPIGLLMYSVAQINIKKSKKEA